MNQKQIEYVIDTIDSFLEEYYPKIKAEPVMDGRWLMQEYAHLKYMIPQMKEMAKTIKYSPDDYETREKLMRWIGFAQGALWGVEHFTVNELREMNTHGSS